MPCWKNPKREWLCAWRRLSSRDAWFLAPDWLMAGFAFVSVNFDLAPSVDMTIECIEEYFASTGTILDCFTPQECAHYLANAGYASVKT